MAEHANLSPSAAGRWLQCPASLRMEREHINDVEDGENEYAAEGTAAHMLAELVLSNKRHKPWVEKYGEKYDRIEMRKGIEPYVRYVKDRVIDTGGTLLLEQRLFTGIDDCWGTGDTIILAEDHIEIADLKYGQGVMVSAIENPQLRLYGLGALETFGLLGEFEYVKMTIVQPRLGHVSSVDMTVEDLLAWREEIRDTAADALAGSTVFGPSESACRWCPVKNICKARMEACTAEDFGNPAEVLSIEELSEALDKVDMIKAWCEDVKKHALHLAYEQEVDIPGYKVIRAAGRRVIVDEEGAAMALEQLGHNPADYGTWKINGIGKLEILVGKDNFSDILGQFVAKKEGSPSLVPEAHRSAAINKTTSAKEDFEDE